GTDTELGVMVLLPRHLPLPLATSMTACGQIGAQVRADGTMQPRMLGTPAGVTSNTSVFISGSPNSTSAAPQNLLLRQKNVFAGGGSRQPFANCPGRWPAPRRRRTFWARRNGRSARPHAT